MDKKFAELRVNDFNTRIIPSNIYYYKETLSTNTEALNLASLRANDGALVITDNQTLGRGRFNREWISPAYLNVLASLILRPQMSQIHSPKITIMVSLGITKGIQKATGINPKIKWPNDIMVSNKKLCGILTEIRSNTNYIISGFGINVNMKESDFPKELKNNATSLKIELEKEIDRFEILHSVLKEIDGLYEIVKDDGFDKIISGYKTYAEPFFGQMVRVAIIGPKRGRKVIEGIALDIDTNGNLVLRSNEGVIYNLSGGETTIL
jgi:BirA family biotin operon repressor/biotin-[acetyl-CoA-carboxylase] ligase